MLPAYGIQTYGHGAARDYRRGSKAMGDRARRCRRELEGLARLGTETRLEFVPGRGLVA